MGVLSSYIKVETRASSRVAGARVRLKIEEDSLRKIRAEMPTTNDKWVVEKVHLS